MPFTAEDTEIIDLASRRMADAGLDVSSFELNIYKKSFDARRKNDIKSVCSVGINIPEKICLSKIEGILSKVGGVIMNETEIAVERGNDKMPDRPLVVGMGPAGLFCALLLAENGYRPVIIDRGPAVDERVSCVDKFYK